MVRLSGAVRSLPYGLRSASLRAVVALIYALAAALVGFGHAPGAVRAGSPAADLAALVLPDGTLPQLCLAAGDDAGGTAGSRNVCDACRLTAAPGLGPVPGLLATPPDRRAEPIAAGAVTAIEPASAIAPRARGPPPPSAAIF